jgi:hypothetical protein
MPVERSEIPPMGRGLRLSQSCETGMQDTGYRRNLKPESFESGIRSVVSRPLSVTTYALTLRFTRVFDLNPAS